MSQFSKRHFHDLDIKELIHQYKQYNCLWNYNSPEYKCKSSKQEAWREIANYFQKDVNEVKRKVKYLRSAYVGEKRKVDASRKSGAEDPYKPSLFYYNELNFLDNIVVLRKFGNGGYITDFDFENTTISQDTENNEDHFNFENEEDTDHKKTEIRCKVETYNESDIEIPLSPKTRSTPKIASSRSLSSRPVKRKMSGESKLDKSVSSNVSSNTKYNNIYISFGNTIALQLQQMPLEIAILAMSEIQVILTKKTLEHIKCLPRNEDSCSYSESADSCNDLIEETFNDSS